MEQGTNYQVSLKAVIKKFNEDEGNIDGDAESYE